VTTPQRHRSLFLGLGLFFLVALLANLTLGQVAIPVKEVLKSLTGSTAEKSTWEYIIIHFRLPKAITACIVGMGLSTCGLLMQTLFRNPLAGPYVLGLSSGSSLGVAFVIMGAAFLPEALRTIFLSPYGIVTASCLGSFGVLVLVLIVSRKLRDTAGLLIVGLMFGSFTSAIVSVLSYFSSAEQLQRFTFWSMGNIGNLSMGSIGILGICLIIGLLLSLSVLKALDGLLLGENYASSMGIPIYRSRLIIIAATCILSGSITAFAGPIAFIGLAVPHVAKLLFQTNKHTTLFSATLLLGTGIMLSCDTVSQLPGFNFTLPINAITSILGAPIVIWLMVRKKSIL
jgi:iron complex transport system permease protein